MKAQISFDVAFSGDCAPVEVEFINTSAVGDNYSWNIGGTFYNAEDTVLTFENSGSYSITLYAYDGFAYLGATSKTIKIEGVPEAGLIVSKDSA
ncbi:MAG: hypothetical protein GVY19_01725 [Bacteroidetes bacterium]|nr:hypothetical protein [Bacteroidota bacterium]